MSDYDPSSRDRADRVLVSQGVFDSRASARAAIEAGGVWADGIHVIKPSQMVSTAATIEAKAAHPYVSRGGIKLAHGLDVFGVDPAGRRCLDLGASTGGFTEVLLLREAAHVIAVDVGRDQLHPTLRHHPRVTSLEGQDARTLSADMLGAVPSLIVSDVSFVALEKILEVPLSLASSDAEFVGLFKPQFQVGRAHVGKGGLVMNAEQSDRAADAFSAWMKEKGWPIQSWTASPIPGGDGNAERLFHAMRT